MLVPTTGFLAGFAGVAAALWLLAAIFPRSTITLLGVVSSVLVAAALTWRVVALNRAGLALLPHIRGHALSRHAGRVEWGLLTVGALAASLAAALLAWHIAGARGGWRPAVSWLAALAAIHLLAVLSALARRGSSTVPAWVGLVGCGLLLAYIALASAGRIAGA